ncbi:nucleolar pre-ribosomal-associated protein 1-like [Acridotheres tristis]
MAARVSLPDLLNLAAKGGWHSKEPARPSGMPAHDADTDPTAAGCSLLSELGTQHGFGLPLLSNPLPLLPPPRLPLFPLPSRPPALRRGLTLTPPGIPSSGGGPSEPTPLQAREPETIKVSRDSGAFEYTWKELSIWLEHLDNTKEDQKEAEIQFLERILVKLVTNPCPYTDKAADLVQAASVLQVALFKQDSDNISMPVSLIDDVLDMVDVLIEDSDGFDEEVGFSLNEDMIIQTFPFSAVVPAALEARNKQVHVGLDADPSC